MKLIVKLLLSAVSVMVIANFLPGVTLVDPIKDAIIVAVVLAVLNVLVKPILIILTLPITIVTLGLFLLIINVYNRLSPTRLVSFPVLSSRPERKL